MARGRVSKEDPEFNDHDCSQRNIQVDNDNIISDVNPDSIVDENTSGCDSHDDETNVTSGRKVNDFFSTNDLKDSNNKMLNNCKSANKEVKQCASAMILLVRNYLKGNGNGDNIQMTSHRVDAQKEQINAFVRTRKNIIYQRGK